MELRNNCLILHGGVDLDPTIYGEKPHPRAQSPNKWRDAKEIIATKTAFQNKLPVIGICRGAQLLCVLNGGKLYQHTDSHGSGHEIETFNKKRFHATASHHQVMRLEKTKHEVLAWDVDRTVVEDGEQKETLLEKSPEIVYFPKTNSLAIQPHPEWAKPDSDFRKFVDELVLKYFGITNFCKTI